MIFGVSPDTWEKLFLALATFLTALGAFLGWLQGYLKDRRIERKAEIAKAVAERTDSRVDALTADVQDAGIETTKPPPKENKCEAP